MRKEQKPMTNFANFFTTVFVDTWLWKTTHPRKRFKNFRQSCVLLTDRIEIHQLQALVWPSNLLYVIQSGCDWWISIRSVNNTQDWRKFWKRYCGCIVFQSRVSTKTVVISTLFPRDICSLPLSPLCLVPSLVSRVLPASVPRSTVELVLFRALNSCNLSWRPS